MNALAERGHLVLCELDDVRFLVDPADRVVGSWLIWHGGWQRREIITAVEHLSAAGRLSRDAVFVDVGAHIGTHTVYALRTGRFARAVAFEPAPRNARLLAMNLDLNGMAGTAVVVPKAAGAITGTAMLYLHPRNSGAHSIGSPPSVDGRDRLCVPIVRVEDEAHCPGVAARSGRTGMGGRRGPRARGARRTGRSGRSSGADRVRVHAQPIRRRDQTAAGRPPGRSLARPCTAWDDRRERRRSSPRRASKPTTYWSTDWSRAKERAFSHLQAALVFDLMSVSDRSKPNLRHARRRNR